MQVYGEARTYTPEQAQQMYDAGVISEARYQELSQFSTEGERQDRYADLALACRRGDQTACASLEALRRDATKIQIGAAARGRALRADVSANPLKYAGIAAAIGAVGYYLTKGKR